MSCLFTDAMTSSALVAWMRWPNAANSSCVRRYIGSNDAVKFDLVICEVSCSSVAPCRTLSCTWASSDSVTGPPLAANAFSSNCCRMSVWSTTTLGCMSWPWPFGYGVDFTVRYRFTSASVIRFPPTNAAAPALLLSQAASPQSASAAATQNAIRRNLTAQGSHGQTIRPQRARLGYTDVFGMGRVSYFRAW